MPAFITGTMSEEQSLSFKVMRLCRPGFHQFQPVCAESQDVLGCLHDVGCDIVDSSLLGSAGAGHGFGLTGMLTLPPNFGKTFIGETFSSYISAFNHSSGDVTNVGLKAELQTKTTKKTLLDTTSSPLPVFSSADSHDSVVEAVLRELGTHILVCSAQYINSFGEKRAFRQFFKFQVLEAFDTHKEVRVVAHGDHGRHTLLLEVELRSKLPTPVFVEDVVFREAPMFHRVECSAASVGEPPLPVTTSSPSTLGSNEVRKFLYTLEAKRALPLAQGTLIQPQAARERFGRRPDMCAPAQMPFRWGTSR